MMLSDLRKRTIGSVGEQIVADFFISKGCSVEFADDPFDGEKDLIIDGKYAEVKTQTLYRHFIGNNRPAFTIPITSLSGKPYHNQINKCMNVELLYFVQRPSAFDSSIKIYQAPKLGRRPIATKVNSVDKRAVCGILLQDLTLVGEIKDQDLVEVLREDSR